MIRINIRLLGVVIMGHIGYRTGNEIKIICNKGILTVCLARKYS